MTTHRKSEALIGLMLILILSYFGLFFVDVQHVIYAIVVTRPVILIMGQSSTIEKVLGIASIIITGILSYLNYCS